MKMMINTSLKYKIISFVLIVFCLSTNKAQDIPFNCDYNAYLFQYNDVYAIDLASGNSYEVATNITTGNINAAAYNPADGYIWGYLSSPSKSIVRIGKNFNTTTFYIDELGTSGNYVGAISATGIYCLKGGGTSYYKIDLDPLSANYTKSLSTQNLTQNISIHDWAFNAVDGFLYAVEKGTNILYRINADTGHVETIGEVPVLSGLNYTYGAVYFDASGRFYVSANQTGTVYVIFDVQNLNSSSAIASNIFAFGPSSSSNDGARCPTAPVPQEDCTNGIDDDGDGLIDCEDPSCSGVAACPTIEAPTSGANNGGLESNNRLSEQINKRNFNRVKNNYTFNRATAKRFARAEAYETRRRHSNFELTDLIPLNVINEEEAIETSPLDLITITNATELYAVDYMRHGKPVASVLALKTENGVYEHTKYICDRLLGAQLIAVSTIEIKGHSFIRALIRNADGALEFVLSLSAKMITNDREFSIESHWNLDKYETGIPFYNFQIWSNSLDNLLQLGEAVIDLLEAQKPVVAYKNSRPPTVFVRKGNYTNGKLNLQVVNTNGTKEVTLDAGIRETETSPIHYMTSTINLNRNYLSTVEIETGHLFDIGFRIGDGIKTPDDLFLSDGPWGVDDYVAQVNTYEIQPNEFTFEDHTFPVERNVFLNANTSEYVSAYRALTPKFNPVNLSQYDSFKFQGAGTGILEVRCIKQSIDQWEKQYKTHVLLTEDFQEFTIPLSSFTSTNGDDLEPNDVISIVFTMVATNGGVETKEMHLKALHFLNAKVLSVETASSKDTLNTMAIPNPMQTHTTIHFTATGIEEATLLVYNRLGKRVKEIDFKTVKGENTVKLNREQLSSGLYFVKIESTMTNYKPSKLIIR